MRAPFARIKVVLTSEDFFVKGRKLLRRQDKFKGSDSFRTFADVMPQIAFIADNFGEMNYFNDPWYAFIGRDETDVIGWQDSSLLHSSDYDRTLDSWIQSLGTSEPFEIEFRLRRFDGVYIWHLARALPVLGPLGNTTMWVGTITDIHEQKEYQAKIELQKIQREDLVAGFSHDLRAPMTAAKLKAHLIDRKSNSEEIKLLANQIAANMDRADRMISNILDASLIESGKPMRLNIKSFSLSSLMNTVISEYQSIYGQRFSIKPNGPLIGHWDEDAMKRILENLISNAIKYGKSNSSINISLRMDGDSRVSLTIHNEGLPIPQEDLPTLFEVFKRSSSSFGKLGWGIGLKLVKGLTEAHGGNVQVTSSEEDGTTFTITLPLDARVKA